MRTALLWTLVACLTTSDVTAQQAPQLEPGSRVRVWARDALWIGTFERLEGDSLLLRLQSDEAIVGLSRDAVGRVDVSVGKKRKTVTGLVIGFGAGFVLGIVAGSAVEDESSFGPDPAAIGAFFGTWGASTVVGAVVGTAIQVDRWKRVPPEVMLQEVKGAEMGLAVQMQFRL